MAIYNWSMAKTGSWVRVRWGPVTWALSSALSTCCAAPTGQTVARRRSPTTSAGPAGEADDSVQLLGDLDQLPVGRPGASWEASVWPALHLPETGGGGRWRIWFGHRAPRMGGCRHPPRADQASRLSVLRPPCPERGSGVPVAVCGGWRGRRQATEFDGASPGDQVDADQTTARIPLWRVVGVTMTGSGEFWSMRSLIPCPETRCNPRSRRDPSTMASHFRCDASSTIRLPTSSSRAEHMWPSVAMPATCMRSTAWSTSNWAYATVSSGGIRRDLLSSRTWKTVTLAPDLPASPMVKSTAACPASNWSIASNSLSLIPHLHGLRKPGYWGPV